MSSLPVLTRRACLQALAAGAWALGFKVQAQGPAQVFSPNAWLTLLPGGDLEVWLSKTEIGQGAPTAMAQILCAELGADPTRCHLRLLDPRGSRTLMTGGSTSLMGAWRAGRPAAAAMREALVRAAAQVWGVEAADCHAQDHAVHHQARSLGFAELLSSARLQALPAQPSLRPTLNLGQSLPPAHWTALLQGKLAYGIDVRLPGQRFAVIARAPRIGARLLDFDAAAARAVPGVEAVLVMPGTPWPASHFVRGGVVVVARNSWAAQQGRQRLRPRWAGGERGAAAPLADSQALAAALARAVSGGPSKDRGMTSLLVGSEAALARALQGAAKVLDLQYAHPLQAHVPMEPMNATARFDDAGDCEVWAPNHSQSHVLAGLAAWLQLPKERITLHTPWVGGSFGRRLDGDYALEAAWVARELRQPVQVLWTRDDDLRCGMFSPPSHHRLRIALAADGQPLAFSHDLATVSVLRQVDPASLRQTGGVDRAASADAPRFPANVPLLRCRQWLLNEPVRVFWWRRGYSANHCFALESAVDEMALALGADPIEYRLRMLAQGPLRRWPNGEDGESQDPVRMSAVLTRLRELLGARPSPHWGVACTNLGDTHLAQAVELEPQGRGWRAARVITVVDCGQVVNPAGAAAQVEGSVVFGLTAALKGPIRLRAGAVQQGNFGDYPILRLEETPALAVDFVSSTASPSGLGEPAAHTTAAALANALARASGRRQRSLPLRLA